MYQHMEGISQHSVDVIDCYTDRQRSLGPERTDRREWKKPPAGNAPQTVHLPRQDSPDSPPPAERSVPHGGYCLRIAEGSVLVWVVAALRNVVMTLEQIY